MRSSVARMVKEPAARDVKLNGPRRRYSRDIVAVAKLSGRLSLTRNSDDDGLRCRLLEVRMLEDVGIKEVSEEVNGRRFLPELRLSLPRRSKS